MWRRLGLLVVAVLFGACSAGTDTPTPNATIDAEPVDPVTQFIAQPVSVSVEDTSAESGEWGPGNSGLNEAAAESLGLGSADNAAPAVIDPTQIDPADFPGQGPDDPPPAFFFYPDE